MSKRKSIISESTIVLSIVFLFFALTVAGGLANALWDKAVGKKGQKHSALLFV